MNNNNSNDAPDYAVVIVFSGWPLRNICSFLEEYVEVKQEDIGVIRIDRGRDGSETNRTIILFKREFLDKARGLGYTESQRGFDFRMSKYEVREHNYPREGYTRNFYIPVPKEINGEYARYQLQNKIDVLTGFGMFTSAPRLKLPLESRETGIHKGRAFITFSRDTPSEVVALARICLHDTRFYINEKEDEDDNYCLMKCYWAKQRKDLKKGRKGKGKRKPIPSNTVKKSEPLKVLEKDDSTETTQEDPKDTQGDDPKEDMELKNTLPFKLTDFPML